MKKGTIMKLFTVWYMVKLTNLYIKKDVLILHLAPITK